MLARYNADGTLDDAFGDGGLATTDFGGDDDAAGVAVQPDGRIVVVGNSYVVGNGYDFALARFNADGTLDPSFGTGGLVTTDFDGQTDNAHGLALQPDGRIVVAGFTYSAPTYDTDFALARYDADGTLDDAFGTGGLVTTDFGGDYDAYDYAYDLALQPDGDVVVVGEVNLGAAWGLARYLGGAGAPPLTVTLSLHDAPVVIPPEGGALTFDLTVANAGAMAEAFAIWTEAARPDGAQLVVRGPFSVSLSAGEAVTKGVIQAVPGRLPSGAYTYTAYAGTYPDGAVASDGFTFTKEGAAARLGGGAAGALTSDGWVLRYAGSLAPVEVGDVWAAGAPAASAQASAARGGPSAGLLSAHPNPSPSRTVLAFELPEAGAVRLTVYDALGREVAVLVDGVEGPGRHEVTFDGSGLPAGVYLVRMTTGDGFAQTAPLTLIR